MARLSLTKASLTKQKLQLKTFGDILPALDLKRRQLSAQRASARQRVVQLQEQLAQLEATIANELPMVANDLINLNGLVKVKQVEIVQENVLGTWLPKIKQIQIEVRDYALLGKPFWVDRLVELWQIALKAKIELQVEQERVNLLQQAERVMTQRFNLFDKLLIPRTRANIKKIQIYLSDAERAGVVNSKLAKGKKQGQTL